MELFNYQNYRDILKFHLKKNPQKGKTGKLAEALGVHSTQLSRVLGGQKDLSVEQAFAACEYFEFTDTETRYFILLVEKERAGTHKLKRHFANELERVRKESQQISTRLKEHRNLSDEEKSIFYSTWLYSAISLFCSIDDGMTVEQICEHFQINRKRAVVMLDFLVQHGLCDRKGDRYVMGTQHTHVPANSPHAIKHHLNWRIKSLQQQERLQERELAFTAPMSLSEEDFIKIREKITAAIKDCIDVAKDSKSEHLAVLVIDWLKV